MNVLQVSFADSAGGAESVAFQLAQGLRGQGHGSWMAVGEKRTSDPSVLLLNGNSSWKSRIYRCVHQKIQKRLGRQVCYSPESWHLLDMPPARPDLIHLHNLHAPGGYFDLRVLPFLSQQIPVLVTLHDAWLLSGHCAHSFECDRWRTGCGKCPDLSIYPAVRRDATSFNWRHRRELFSRSRLFITSPSHWLMERVKSSILAPAIIESKVIPNGVNTTVFRPVENKAELRAKLNLPAEALILLFSANGIRNNIWKDFEMLRHALKLAAQCLNKSNVLLLAIGEEAAAENITSGARIQFVAYQPTAEAMASYYQAADIYVHAARAEVWGLVITEAMASGCSVVATRVGGIPEQIEEGVTGFLTPPGDPKTMAKRIVKLAHDKALQQRISHAAALRAKACFDSSRQIQAYLDFYMRAIARHRDLATATNSHRPCGAN